MIPTVLPLPLAARRSGVARRLAALVRPFWVVPAVWCVAAVAAGLVVPAVEVRWFPDHLPVQFPGGVDGARTVLSTIAGAMISVTGVVFSITMVVLQLASSQYSPRVLQTFLEDRTTQHTLGLFAASFLYALTVLRAVDPSEGAPRVAVSLAFVLVLGAVAVFLAFIHQITVSVSVADILQRTAQRARVLLESGQEAAWPTSPVALPTPDGVDHVLVAPRSGYLDCLDVAPLTRVATRLGVRVEVLHPLGAFVVAGSPLVRVRGVQPGDGEFPEEEVLRHLVLRGERTMDQDVGFGLRRLVDVAERALSPGINDPTTALQVLDQLHDLLRRMVTTPARWPVCHDEHGVARLVLRQPSLDEVVELALADIAHWGEEHRRVTERIAAIMEELRAAALDEHRPGLG